MADPKTSRANPLTPVSFDALWGHYPSKDPCVNPTTRTKAYDNQCAIRVGMALERSGVHFVTFKGPRCQFGPRANGMVLRAQELANWLKTRPFPGCPEPLQFSGKGFQKNLAARKGIVFFQDYWLRAGERQPTGDHIDLWNMDRLTPSWQTFARFTIGIARIPSVYSDLENSRSVVFWPFA
ncbi:MULTISPECIES: type VI secretion system amidase effector protein Tae4 [unclassified Acidovorax]|uniref:type VI secretion system amidase effector protein Tae4 n=1 Tax=unclassified Acidovorax TaxID=2684926 RepID=UPI0009E9E197|nr:MULTISPECIES: type VI secretion system amidase effector protein Tae4 [unclassified Acidovorax]